MVARAQNPLCYNCPSGSSCNQFQSVGGCGCSVDCGSKFCTCTICGECVGFRCLQYCDSPSSLAGAQAQKSDPNKWWRPEVAQRLISQVAPVSPLFAGFLEMQAKFFARREAGGAQPACTGNLLRGKFSGTPEQPELDWALQSVERVEDLPTQWTFTLATKGNEPNQLVIAASPDGASWTLLRDGRVLGSGEVHVAPAGESPSQPAAQPEAPATRPERNGWWSKSITAQLIPEVAKHSNVFAEFLQSHQRYFLRKEASGPVTEAYSRGLRGKFSARDGGPDLDWRLQSVERPENSPTKWTYWMSTDGEQANLLEISVLDDDVSWTLRRNSRYIASGSFTASHASAKNSQ